ncbi:hypothetical protein DFH09DRAFT_859902, partial [Mycena vulgaris]
LRLQPLSTPLPWSIWDAIVRDGHVSFPKLLASTEHAYDHADNHVEFAGGFVLVKNHELVASQPITSESDWARMFSAWEAGVLLLYPHRRRELLSYRQIVIELFRTAHPLIAIDFDDQARFKYSRSPFRLDDRELLQPTILACMMSLAAPSSPHSSPLARTAEHPTSLSPNPTLNRSAVPCENWNLGRCENNPCVHGRLHGRCTECGASHRALEHEDCHWGLLAQRRDDEEFSRFGSEGSQSG